MEEEEEKEEEEEDRGGGVTPSLARDGWQAGGEERAATSSSSSSSICRLTAVQELLKGVLARRLLTVVGMISIGQGGNNCEELARGAMARIQSNDITNVHVTKRAIESFGLFFFLSFLGIDFYCARWWLISGKKYPIAVACG